MAEYTDLSCDSPETAAAVKAYLDEQMAEAEDRPDISVVIHKSTLRLRYGDEVEREDWDMQLLGFRDGWDARAEQPSTKTDAASAQLGSENSESQGSWQHSIDPDLQGQ